MLNFILYNPIFEILLGIVFFINMSAIYHLDCKQSISSSEKIENNFDIIHTIKITIILVFLVILIIIVVNFFLEYLFTLLLIFIMIISLIKSVIIVHKNDNNFTLDNKYHTTFATIFFIVLLASHAVPIYINSFEYTTHFIKEILLLLFINLKLILFVFLILINIPVLISNITEILTEKQKNVLKKFLTKEYKSYKLIEYNFSNYNKCKTTKNLIIDSIIYTILLPITLVINLLDIIILKLTSKFFDTIIFFINIFCEYKNKRNLIIKKITYVSIIFSLFISYIIIVTNNNLFADTTKDLFTYISTVILIPLIYDSIKNN